MVTVVVVVDAVHVRFWGFEVVAKVPGETRGNGLRRRHRDGSKEAMAMGHGRWATDDGQWVATSGLVGSLDDAPVASMDVELEPWFVVRGSTTGINPSGNGASV